LPRENYKTQLVANQFYDRLQTELTSAPGIQSVGIGSDLPWTGYDDNAGFNIEGKQPAPHQSFHGRYHAASPDFFRALGIPLLRGRFFAAGDTKDAPTVMIVNQALASRYWPNEDALSKRITFEDNPKPKDWITIVGIVGDVKDKPNSPAAEPAYWWPLPQAWDAFPQMSLVVRSDADPAVLTSAVREQVRRLDPTLALADVRLMDQIADAGVAAPRFAFLLVGLFAGLAMLLAAIGIYGVISYSVNQRIPEFGLRLALGAPPRGLMRMVLAQAAKLAIVGSALGIVAALMLSRYLQSMVYDVSASDPLTFAAVGFMVMAIALLACYLPARRATRANPMVALRAE
jgi:predicted permease